MSKTQCNILKNKMTGILAAVLVLVLILAGCGSTADQLAAEANTDTTPFRTQEAALDSADKTKDLRIDIDELSAKPKFFSADANGTEMEIVALRASDGSVRTAFNTCQVCYSSGRGYYKADGNELVCQNCGNRFTGDAVGVLSGGCNPVPITEKSRIAEDGMITIPGSLLDEASVIFENWK